MRSFDRDAAKLGRAGGAPMICVVIPTYHRNDLLRRCLNALAHQNQSLASSQYEVLVTDDGSSSNAENMIRAEFPWVRWTAGPRRGPAANRNHGVSQVTSEWVALTDDDCVPGRDWLKEFEVALTSGLAVYEGRTTCNAGIKSPLDEAPINATGGYLWSCNMMISRHMFEEVGGFNEGFPAAAAEDIEFYSRLRKSEINVKFVPKATVDHPPRRRHLGLAAAKVWRSRLLLEAMLGSTRKEWLPIHVLKVRVAQLRGFTPSVDWIPYLGSIIVEVAAVAFSCGRWKAQSMRHMGKSMPEQPQVFSRLPNNITGSKA